MDKNILKLLILNFICTVLPIYISKIYYMRLINIKFLTEKKKTFI